MMLPPPKDKSFRIKPDKARFMREEKIEDQRLLETGAWGSEDRADSFSKAEIASATDSIKAWASEK